MSVIRVKRKVESVKFKEGTVHVVLPDPHSHPQHDNRRADYAGCFIRDTKPDTVIVLGDTADMPSLCVERSTPITKADLTTCRADELLIGDSVLGFYKGDKYWHLTAGTVTNNLLFKAVGYLVRTTHGDVKVAAGHQFLASPKDAPDRFISVEKLRPGVHTIRYTYSPLNADTLSEEERGYLKGFLDGEGYFGDGRLTWSQNDGPIADYVKQLMQRLDVPVRYYEESSRPRLKHYYIQGSSYNSMKVLAYIRPIRLLPKLLESIEGRSVMSWCDHTDALVLSVEPIEESVDVVGLETTCSTYVSSGLLSHNCSYDRGTKAFQGRTYKADVEAHYDFQERLWAPSRQAKKRMPRRVTLIGNHEQRIDRAIQIQPELEGVISYKDLNLDRWYTDVVHYDGATPGSIEIDGVTYAHYLVSGISGRPIYGEHHGYSLLAKNHSSCTVGHSHTLDYCIRTRADGSKIMGLSAGVFVDYRPSFAGSASNLWNSCVIKKTFIKPGVYDIEVVSLEKLRKEYGNA